MRRPTLTIPAVLCALLALTACETAGGPPPAAPSGPPVAAQPPTPVVPDPDLTQRVEAQWQTVPDIADRLDVSVSNGRALLTGRAATPDQRVQAVRLAWQVDGLREVINEIQVDDQSTLTDGATDSWIHAQMRSRLLFDSGIRSLNYTVVVVNQTLYLMGQADSQAELDRVLGHARAVPRVRQVVNHVRL